jgi:hypothetical protein
MTTHWRTEPELTPCSFYSVLRRPSGGGGEVVEAVCATSKLFRRSAGDWPGGNEKPSGKKSGSPSCRFIGPLQWDSTAAFLLSSDLSVVAPLSRSQLWWPFASSLLSTFPSSLQSPRSRPAAFSFLPVDSALSSTPTAHAPCPRARENRALHLPRRTGEGGGRVRGLRR